MSVTEVAKTVAGNLQGSCLAAVALAGVMAVLTYLALKDEEGRKHEALMKILELCPVAGSYDPPTP